jgi:hypothetical protein
MTTRIRMTSKKLDRMRLNGFTCVQRGEDYTFYSKYAKKPFSFGLVKNGSGYSITPPEYRFIGTISHFTFSEDENRQYRNKGVIKKIVKALFESHIWTMIKNKDFFTPNTANSKMDIGKVKQQYKELITKQ